MSNKNTNHTNQQLEEFRANCNYLSLKLLSEQYQQFIDRAIQGKTGYYDFIRDIVQAETAAKLKRRVEYLVKTSRLPYPLKILADFNFDFQPKLNRTLIMDLASLRFIERS